MPLSVYSPIPSPVNIWARMFGRGAAHGPENRSQLLDYMGQAEAHEHTYGIHDEMEIALQ